MVVKNIKIEMKQLKPHYPNRLIILLALAIVSLFFCVIFYTAPSDDAVSYSILYETIQIGAIDEIFVANTMHQVPITNVTVDNIRVPVDSAYLLTVLLLRSLHSPLLTYFTLTYITLYCIYKYSNHLVGGLRSILLLCSIVFYFEFFINIAVGARQMTAIGIFLFGLTIYSKHKQDILTILAGLFHWSLFVVMLRRLRLQVLISLAVFFIGVFVLAPNLIDSILFFIDYKIGVHEEKMFYSFPKFIWHLLLLTTSAFYFFKYNKIAALGIILSGLVLASLYMHGVNGERFFIIIYPLALMGVFRYASLAIVKIYAASTVIMTALIAPIYLVHL